MSRIRYEQEGVVFDLQRFSIHDGPGIRSIVFLKGCPLSCRWCCNPESQKPAPQLMYQKSSCVRCTRCIEVCPVGALSFDVPDFVARDACISCGRCAEVCLTGALARRGQNRSVRDVVEELRQDALAYRRSGGGITVSGGEPLAQPEFAAELLKACREQGWTTAMETTGCAPQSVVERVMPLVDYALLDVKSVDPDVHRVNTGIDNRQILENALRIAQLAGSTTIRTPVVPGVNDRPEAIRAIGAFAKLMPGVDAVHLLPYHRYGESKYALLGRSNPMGDAPALPKESVEPLQRLLEDMGLQCVIGG